MLCLAVAAGWAVLVWHERPARQALIEAYGAARPVEGRLTDGPAYAPYKAGTRLRPSSLKAARRAERRILATTRTRGPRELRDLALLALLAGDPAKAVALLKRAAAVAPGDAAVQSDLAAVYIARGSTTDGPYDYVQALAAADQALKIAPLLPEALFNHALALEKLSLATVARRAWREALARETDEGWKSEEQSRLQSLNGSGAVAVWDAESRKLEEAAARGDTAAVAGIVGHFAQPARLYAEEKLLAQWAREASEERWTDAGRTLRVARAIGFALVQRGGDAMVRDAVAAIDAAQAEPSGERLRHLVEGHRDYGAGLDFYRSQNRDFDLAARELTKAESHLRRGGTPFAHWAGLYLASIDYFHPRLDEARARLEGLRHSLPAGRYLSLEGRIALVLGSIEILRGRPGDALARLQESRALFTRSGETEDMSYLLQNLSRVYRSLGDADEAWKELHAGLRLAARLQTPRQLAAILDEAGFACLESDHPGVGLYFQNETLALGRQIGDRGLIAAARRRRASTLLRIGRSREAGEEIAVAQKFAALVPDESRRRLIEAEILTTRAEITRPLDASAAVRDLTTAIHYYELAQFRHYLPVVDFLRARAHLARGDEALAESDFRAGLAEIEAARASVLDPQLRIALYDQAAALFEETMAFLMSRGRAVEAFQVAEQGRARQLLESFAVASLATGSRPLQPDHLLSLAEIRHELPPRTVLIRYAVLQHRLLIWAFSREGESFRQIPIRRTELEALVGRARSRLLTGGDRRSSGELQELYRRLVGPVEDRIASASEVVFIPDRALNLLPFAALVSPGSGRYLVEDRAVSVAPSANVYVRCLRRLHRQQPPRSALVVGASDFDRQRFPSLPPLPSVKKEAELVAALYPQRWLLTGPDATRERFLAHLESHQPEVLHFAGHAVLNVSLPELSTLLFAPDPGKADSGAVYSHEVYALRLNRVRLAVLSACDTATGRLSAGEGAMGLARPFLAAGVPTVLASLGAVEDRQGREILTSFHRRLEAGDTPAQALRTTQMSRIANGGESAKPAHWALFEIIGASPPTYDEE